jgi:hypothetical protein
VTGVQTCALPIYLQNDVVRLRIDKLKIAGQSEKLDGGLKEIIAQLEQKESLINQSAMQTLRNKRT